MRNLMPAMIAMGLMLLSNGLLEESGADIGKYGCVFSSMDAIAKKPPRNKNLDVHKIFATIPV